MRKSKANSEEAVRPSLKEAIQSMMDERHMSEELVREMIVNTIKAAYKKKYQSDENCYVEIAEDNSKVEVFKRKTIVADGAVEDDFFEIELSEAKEINSDADIEDEILIPVDPTNFDRVSIYAGKQKFKQDTRENQKNKVYMEFKSKEKEIVTGYVQTTDPRTGDVLVDFGNGTTGILFRKYQNPLEQYRKDEKIYCYIEEVRESDRGVDIILSRSSKELVRKFLELNIPEISDGSIEIYNIVRNAGYKTKVAVYATKEGIDPVGTCVGLKGSRIQGIITEIGGEKIDIVEYNEQIELFIAHALAPATIKMVRVADYATRKAYAVADDRELSFAIGKEGMNVQLANKITDWLIDIKTEKQYRELDLDRDIKDEAGKLFSDDVSPEVPSAAEISGIAGEPADDVSDSDEMAPDAEENLYFDSMPLSDRIKEKISARNISTVEEYAELGTMDALDYFKFTTKEYKEFISVLGQYVELVEED